jgi:hypothetical protein
MLLGKYIVTNHAIDQYDDRIEFKTKRDIIKCIEYDLRTLNIKNVIYGEDHIYVFTKGYKEFIFRKGENVLFLKTVIRRCRNDAKRKFNKRKRLVTN